MRYQSINLINRKKKSYISKTLSIKPKISKTNHKRKPSISQILIKPPKKIPEKRLLPPNNYQQQEGNPNVMAPENEWQIYYGCFFAKPRHCPPSKTPLLRPITRKNSSGVWLSSQSQLRLQLTRHSNGLVLVVSLGGTIYEEHHISKLHFSWPQVSCQEQGPARPSRVVFACYRDGSGQVQKFAMRFLTSSDSEGFVNRLKPPENLNNTINIGNSCKIGSESSRPVKQIRRNGVRIRKARELKSGNPSGNSVPPEQPQLTSEDMRNTCSEEPLLTRVSGAQYASLPSGFTDLLTSVSCTSTEKDAAEAQETPPGFDQKSQADGCKSGPSFHETLTALEMFINELGGDLAL